jgi:hypothetical protein
LRLFEERGGGKLFGTSLRSKISRRFLFENAPPQQIRGTLNFSSRPDVHGRMRSIQSSQCLLLHVSRLFDRQRFSNFLAADDWARLFDLNSCDSNSVAISVLSLIYANRMF